MISDLELHVNKARIICKRNFAAYKYHKQRIKLSRNTLNFSVLLNCLKCLFKLFKKGVLTSCSTFISCKDAELIFFFLNIGIY